MQVLTKIRTGVIILGMPLLTVFFFPFFQDYYDTPRFVGLILFTLLILFFWTIESMKTKKITLAIGPGIIGFGFLTIAATFSLLAVSTNKLHALAHPLGPLLFLCLGILSLILPTMMTKKEQVYLGYTTTIVLGALGLLCLYQQFALTSILFPNSTYLSSPLWNPTGTPFTAIMMFLIGIPLALFLARDSWKEKKEILTTILIASALLMIGAGGILIYRTIPIIQTSLLPFSLGWIIFIETIKKLPGTLFGTGAEQFLFAFTQGRTMGVNTTVLWNTNFSTNATFPFHSATVYGLFGLSACVLLFLDILRAAKTSPMIRILSYISIGILLVFPPSIPFLFLLTIIFLMTVGTRVSYQLSTPGSALIIVASLLFILILGYGTMRFSYGEIQFSKGIAAVQIENNGTKAYTILIDAIKQNPFLDRYHISFSQINLALANAILGNTVKTDEGKTTLPEDDKTLVTTLISQAIREAKIATTLSPNNVFAWANLATTYQNVTGVAKDADTWAIAAYQKAITLDPTNPVLRLDLGGLYISLEKYSEAADAFYASVTLKPNYTNGYYNLANALAKLGNSTEAKKALLQAQSLVAPESTEYQQIAKDLETLDKQESIPVSN